MVNGFISLHPLHMSVEGKFQTAQLQSDSKVSAVHVVLVGTFNIVLLDLLCHFPEVNCDEPNDVLRVTFSKMLVMKGLLPPSPYGVHSLSLSKMLVKR